MRRQMGVCEEQGLWERDSVPAKRTLWLQKASREHVKEWKGLSAYLSHCRLIQNGQTKAPWLLKRPRHLSPGHPNSVQDSPTVWSHVALCYGGILGMER